MNNAKTHNPSVKQRLKGTHADFAMLGLAVLVIAIITLLDFPVQMQAWSALIIAVMTGSCVGYALHTNYRVRSITQASEKVRDAYPTILAFLLVIFGFLSSSVFAAVIVSQLDPSETITGWGAHVHRWSFQNFDSFPGNLRTVKLRLKSISGIDTNCNYSSRVKVTAYDGNLTAYVAPEQDITSSYADYIFDFSSYHIPLAGAESMGSG